MVCHCVNSLDFFFEKLEVASTIVKVLDEFIGALCEAFVRRAYAL